MCTTHMLYIVHIAGRDLKGKNTELWLGKFSESSRAGSIVASIVEKFKQQAAYAPCALNIQNFSFK